MPATTLSDIARLANVSKSLVSKALHHHPRVAPKTVQRIEQLAKELGYHPNPLLASLASKKFRSASSVDHTPLAYVIHEDSSEQHQPGGLMPRTLGRVAEQIGYAFSVHRAEDYRDWAHLSEVLYQRGVAGVMFAPLTHEVGLNPVDWARFAVVMIGLGTVRHPFASVSMDFFLGVRQAWRRLEAIGCERIGFVFPEIANLNLEAEQRVGAFLVQQDAIPKNRRVPVHRHPVGALSEGLLAWYAKYRPDGLIVGGSPAYRALSENGIRIPEETACISVWHSLQHEGELAALRDMREEVCIQAIRQLDTKIRYRELGASEPLITLTIPPGWVPGASCPEPAPGTFLA